MGWGWTHFQLWDERGNCLGASAIRSIVDLFDIVIQVRTWKEDSEETMSSHLFVRHFLSLLGYFWTHLPLNQAFSSPMPGKTMAPCIPLSWPLHIWKHRWASSPIPSFRLITIKMQGPIQVVLRPPFVWIRPDHFFSWTMKTVFCFSGRQHHNSQFIRGGWGGVGWGGTAGHVVPLTHL